MDAVRAFSAHCEGLVASGAPPSDSDREAGMVLVLEMKARFRKLAERAEAAREAARLARAELEAGGLELRALLYERERCEAEAAECRAAAPARPDEDLELVDLETFARERADGPAQAREAGEAGDAEMTEAGAEAGAEAASAALPPPGSEAMHALLMARLRSELAAREASLQRLPRLRARRDALAAAAAGKRAALSAVDADLRGLVAEAKRVARKHADRD